LSTDRRLGQGPACTGTLPFGATRCDHPWEDATVSLDACWRQERLRLSVSYDVAALLGRPVCILANVGGAGFRRRYIVRRPLRRRGSAVLFWGTAWADVIPRFVPVPGSFPIGIS